MRNHGITSSNTAIRQSEKGAASTVKPQAQVDKTTVAVLETGTVTTKVTSANKLIRPNGGTVALGSRKKSTESRGSSSKQQMKSK